MTAEIQPCDKHEFLISNRVHANEQKANFVSGVSNEKSGNSISHKLGKQESLAEYFSHKSVSELSAERLNLFLQQAEHEQIGDNFEGTSLPNNVGPFSSTAESPAKREPVSRKEKWLQCLRISIPHIGLVFISALYTVLGAVVFYCVEQPHERRVRNETLQRLSQMRQKISDQLWMFSHAANVTELSWKQLADEGMLELLKAVHEPFVKDHVVPQDLVNDTGRLQWTFAASIFFSWTAITTIGYGHIVPRTVGGRIGCLVYALFGIPLILVTIADVGRFLSSGIIWVHQLFRRGSRWVTRGCARCIRRACCCCCEWRTASKSGEPVPFRGRQQQRCKRRARADDSPERSGTFEDISEIHSRSQHSPVKTVSNDVTAAGADAATEEAYEEELMRREAERRVSVTFVLIILVGYTAAGAGLLRLWESWSFFDAFYFCFVTVTTIGFGDIVPQRESFLWATLAYIVLGLIITTMCIDLVGSEYIRDIHFYGRNIGRLTQQAFMNFGGKVVHLGEVFGYVAFLQKNYGITPEQLNQMANLPDNYLLECLMRGQQPDPNWLQTRPFIPYDIYYFKWIEQPRTASYASDKLFASMESIDITSRCSTARTPREYYQHILMQYCRDSDTRL